MDFEDVFHHHFFHPENPKSPLLFCPSTQHENTTFLTMVVEKSTENGHVWADISIHFTLTQSMN